MHLRDFVTALGKLAALGMLLAAPMTSAKATADGCAVVLRTNDGFLAVRAGPGTQYREIMRIFPGQIVITSHVSDLNYAGPWWRIGAIIEVMGQPERRIEGYGWVHSGFLTNVNC
jgi:uncharacterized protein YraI